jgi:hypothetical protein
MRFVNKDRVSGRSLSGSFRRVNVLWEQSKDSGGDKKSTVSQRPGLYLAGQMIQSLKIEWARTIKSPLAPLCQRGEFLPL